MFRMTVGYLTLCARDSYIQIDLYSEACCVKKQNFERPGYTSGYKHATWQMSISKLDAYMYM